MSVLRRIGNFGIADIGSHGLATFSMGSTFDDFSTEGVFSRPTKWYENKMRIGGYDIIPLGYNNAMPNELQIMLDEFYAGEGILGKIQGLQWGNGPRLYEERYTEQGEIYRHWTKDDEIMSFLENIDFEEKLLRCHIDLTHGFGYFYKVYRNLGVRIGGAPKIADFEHLPVNKARLEYPAEKENYPKRIIVGDFPNPEFNKLAAYPIWDKRNPFVSPVSMGYQNIYSFAKQFYSTPRFYGAYSFIKIASKIAPLLDKFNENGTMLSYHIESPAEYWTDIEEKLRTKWRTEGKTDENEFQKYLENFINEEWENFTKALSGAKNVNKFLKTQGKMIGGTYVGWKVIPIDKKYKDFIDSQIAISNKADSAATSGFGLSAPLANIIIGGKMNSGAETLYALKSFMASDTKVPEMILFNPINAIIKVNFPNTKLKLGFHHSIIQKESEVSPNDRAKNNV